MATKKAFLLEGLADREALRVSAFATIEVFNATQTDSVSILNSVS
jgi:hypothetical protein